MNFRAKNSKILLSCFAILFSLFFLVACSTDQENAILGKWQHTGSNETLEFFKNGTVSAFEDGKSMGGSYKFIEEGRIQLEIGGIGVLAGPIVAKISITGDEMDLTMPGKELEKYRRVK